MATEKDIKTLSANTSPADTDLIEWFRDDGTTLSTVQKMTYTTLKNSIKTFIGISEDDFTAKGDILVGTGAGAFTKLAAGTNTYVLSSNSVTGTGLEWVTAPTGDTIIVEDEGTPLATAATTLDFVGAGVVASGTGVTKTITITGGTSTLTTADDMLTRDGSADKRLAINAAGDKVLVGNAGGITGSKVQWNSFAGNNIGTMNLSTPVSVPTHEGGFMFYGVTQGGVQRIGVTNTATTERLIPYLDELDAKADLTNPTFLSDVTITDELFLGTSGSPTVGGVRLGGSINDDNVIYRDDFGFNNVMTCSPARKGAGQSVASSTSFTTITGISRDLNSFEVFEFEYEIVYTSGATGGIKFQFQSSLANWVTLTYGAHGLTYLGTTGNIASLEDASGLSSAASTSALIGPFNGGTQSVKISGTVKNGATASTFALQFGQFISDATNTTVLEGARSKFTKLY